MLLFIEILGYQLTWLEVVFGIISGLLMTGAIVKAVKDIRTDGWEPFRNRWATRRKARHQKIIDELANRFNERFDAYQTDTKVLLEKISREVTTNGGSSLKDMVITIDGNMQKIQARIDHQDETNSQPIFHLDAQGGMTFANCAFRELVDAEERELFHRDYLARVEAPDRTRLALEITDAITNKMPFDITVKFRLPSPALSISVRLLATPHVKSGGELLGYFGTASKVE